MRVIESRRWRHTDGRTASIHGAIPWISEADRVGWAIEVMGYTIMHKDGTIGIGRMPFITRDQAEAWIRAHPQFSGMSQG